jgi:hypothetical protein
MKTYITTILSLFIVIVLNAQEELAPQELDKATNVHILKFSPDKKEKTVFSSYMEGETENEAIRFLANGTDLIQKVMVTIYSPDKNSGIKVSIVKDDWEDSKIGGSTENGFFQEGFNTAGKFGIVVTSDIPNINFRLAVWTSGEIKPFMGNLFVPVAQNTTSSGSSKSNTNSANSNEAESNSSKDTNNLMFVLIGVLVIIALFLGVLVFKRKSGKTALIIIFLCLGQHLANANVRPSTADVFYAGLTYATENHEAIRDGVQFASDVETQIERELSPSDSDSRPDPAGGPRLPSSCIPRRYGGTQGNSGGIPQEDCECLDDAYLELDDRRFYFEKLRIIYTSTMNSITAKMALADTASNVHAVSGLAWQNQKMIILKKSIPNLNQAYDDKYEQMIQGLEECLLKIDACEARIGNENWYNHAGFMYYQFMVDKYKRN